MTFKEALVKEIQEADMEKLIDLRIELIGIVGAIDKRLDEAAGEGGTYYAAT